MKYFARKSWSPASALFAPPLFFRFSEAALANKRNFFVGGKKEQVELQPSLRVTLHFLSLSLLFLFLVLGSVEWTNPQKRGGREDGNARRRRREAQISSFPFYSGPHAKNGMEGGRDWNVERKEGGEELHQNQHLEFRQFLTFFADTAVGAALRVNAI